MSVVTRRAALAAAAIIPAMGIAPNAFAREPLSRSLLDAIERYEHACRAVAAFDEDVESPRLIAWTNACNAVPHYRTRNTFTNVGSEAVSLSTESRGTVDMARQVLADMERRGSHLQDADYIATARELIEAGDRRDAEVGALRATFGIDDLRVEACRLGEDQYVAMIAVFETASCHLADLLRKLDFIVAIEAWDEPAAQDAIISDVRRLGGVI